MFAGTNRHVDKTRKTRSRSDDRQNGHEVLQVSAQKCLRRERRCITSSCDNADQFRYGSPNVDSKRVTWWIAAIVIPTSRKDRGVKELIGRLASGSWARDSVSAIHKFDEGSNPPARCSFSEYNWCTVLAPDRGEIRTTGAFFYAVDTLIRIETYPGRWSSRCC